MELKGKTALITGASRGIGREIAIVLSAKGARLGLVGRSEKDLEETKRLAGGGERVEVYREDLRDSQALERIASAAHDALGGVDILLNVAGVWHDQERKYHGPEVAHTSAAEIDEVLGVGLRGSFLLTRLLLPDMMRKRRGKILFLSCGFAGPHEAAGWVHYYVTNKAIEALATGLAAELREYEIQVNCLAPWFVDTLSVRRFYPDQTHSALSPREVAEMAAFLVSPQADSISGQVIELRSKSDHAR